MPFSAEPTRTTSLQSTRKGFPCLSEHVLRFLLPASDYRYQGVTAQEASIHRFLRGSMVSCPSFAFRARSENMRLG